MRQQKYSSIHTTRRISGQTDRAIIYVLADSTCELTKRKLEIKVQNHPAKQGKCNHYEVCWSRLLRSQG